MMALQLGMGIRYYIFTDKVRPFVQAGVGFLRFFSFSSQQGNDCAEPIVFFVFRCLVDDLGRLCTRRWWVHGGLLARRLGHR